MSDVQCGEPEGRVYICEVESIDRVGQDSRSGDCGYFAGYAIKAYHDVGSGHPSQATMNRYQVYGARNVVTGETTRTFSTRSSLQPSNAGRYMASIGMGGYDQRSLSILQSRAYLTVVPDLCRSGNGIMFYALLAGGGHWYALITEHNNRYYFYDPTPRRVVGDTEYHLNRYNLSSEADLSSLDSFFSGCMGMVSVAPSAGGAGGAGTDGTTGGTDEELGDAGWE